jgi:hypothetical protein
VGRSLLLVAAFGLVLGGLSGCRAERLSPPEPAPLQGKVAPRPEPPWLPVHPERLARLAGIPVYDLCVGGTFPRRQVSPSRLTLPAGDPMRRTGGRVFANCLIDPEGWVVQTQLVKGPDQPAFRQDLVRTLADWRFAPARCQDRPTAVHFMVVLEALPDGSLRPG